jgi:transcriptional regulator with XRE-family HTH domain
MSSFSERLQEALARAGLNKAQFAKSMGLSYQAVAKALAGDSKGLNASNNQKAAVMLGVSATWLATGEGPQILAAERLGSMSEEEVAFVELLRALPPEVKAVALASVRSIAAEYTAHVSTLLSRSGA